MMDAALADGERIKENLFELAQMKFDCCTYNENSSKTAELVSLLIDREQLNNYDIDLFKACVSRIWVSLFFTVEIELVNGMKIKNTTERTDKNESCRERNDNTAETTADRKP